MANIHVNTDAMRNLGYIFVQLNERITYQIMNYVQSSFNQLEGDWMGISRQRYEQLYQQWRATIQTLVNSGEQIGQHLTLTANQFDSVDQSS